MKGLFISLYMICKYGFATAFTIMIIGLVLLPIYILVFHPHNFSWTNYWSFFKAGGALLLIFGLGGTFFKRFYNMD